MHLTIKERVELVLMSGADGATNRSVAKKFNRIYPDREHALVRYLRPTLYKNVQQKFENVLPCFADVLYFWRKKFYRLFIGKNVMLKFKLFCKI